MSRSTPIWRASIDEEGKVLWYDPVGVNAWCKSLSTQQVDITIKKTKRQRSLEQNAFWWGVCVEMMAAWMGEDDRDAVHYALLGEWKGHRELKNGFVVPNCTSSSRLTTAGFTELIDWCRRWALVEHGVKIPAPNEVEV